MSGDKVMEKEQELTIEVSENSTKEGGATPIIEKSVTPPVKEWPHKWAIQVVFGFIEAASHQCAVCGGIISNAKVPKIPQGPANEQMEIWENIYSYIE